MILGVISLSNLMSFVSCFHHFLDGARGYLALTDFLLFCPILDLREYHVYFQILFGFLCRYLSHSWV